MKRAATIAAVVIAVQLVLVGAYLWLRDDGGDAARFGLERPRQGLGELEWTAVDGSTESLSSLRGEPVVVHLWATWCGPCREELPELLAFAEDSPVRVVAVTVDPEWEQVRSFVGGEVPPAVTRADNEAVTRAFGTQSLPETWVIGADGEAKAMLRGAGDWADDELRRTVLDLARE